MNSFAHIMLNYFPSNKLMERNYSFPNLRDGDTQFSTGPLCLVVLPHC